MQLSVGYPRLFCVSIKGGPLAATLTLTIHLLEHELHAHDSHASVFSCVHPFMRLLSRRRANGLLCFSLFLVVSMLLPAFLSVTCTHIPYSLSYTSPLLFPLPFPLGTASAFVLPSSFVFFLVATSSSPHLRGSLSWPDLRMSNCTP